MQLKTRLALYALAATALTPVLPVWAQEGDDAAAQNDERRYGPIVVTAQRREESQLDVPLSVSAFDGAALAEMGVVTLDEVAKISPNVTLEASRATNNTLSAFIRGVGQQDPVAGFEAGVGIYLDDVYLNRPQGAILDVFDVERVEVLRGPQGTLYGRNTIGGAVKYVTRPLSDEVEFKAHAAYGSYNQTDVILTGSVPLSDAFRVGAAVAWLTHDGYGKNLVQSGVDNYNKDVLAGRLSAEFDVTPTFQLRFVGDWTEDNSDPKQGHRLIPGRVSGTPVLGDVYDTTAGINVIDQSYEGGGASLVAQWDLNDRFTLKNIVAYREDETKSPIDFDAAILEDVDAPVIYNNDQFSEEFQVSYSGDRLNGIVGLFYLDANASNTFDVLLGVTGDLISAPGLNAQTSQTAGPFRSAGAIPKTTAPARCCAARSSAATRPLSAARPFRSPRRPISMAMPASTTSVRASRCPISRMPTTTCTQPTRRASRAAASTRAARRLPPRTSTRMVRSRRMKSSNS